MLTLGHISYSNCLPVHAGLFECGLPTGVEVEYGVPGELNAKLASGEIDVAPASCVEYPRHVNSYRVLPGLSISSSGPVETIQLLTKKPLEELADGSLVALPTASATSVVLLKIILEQRLGIRPRYFWFVQETTGELAEDVDAALYIGDIARERLEQTDARSYDLGTEWHDWTGLPFVFALWQTNAGPERDEELRELTSAITASREWAFTHLSELASKHAPAFGWSPEGLLRYWRSLSYGWDAELAAGLDQFYRRAVELGELPTAPSPVFLEL